MHRHHLFSSFKLSYAYVLSKVRWPTGISTHEHGKKMWNSRENSFNVSILQYNVFNSARVEDRTINAETVR